MKRYRTVEDEVDEIRLRIYEETKDLTVEQYAERMDKLEEEYMRKYGFKFVSLTE